MGDKEASRCSEMRIAWARSAAHKGLSRGKEG